MQLQAAAPVVVSMYSFTELFRWPRTRASSLRSFCSSIISNQSRGGLPRFFSPNLPPYKGEVVRIEGDEFWHMKKVLRLKENDRIELFDGKGGVIQACIQHIDARGLESVAMEDPKLVAQQGTQWHLYSSFSTLKGGRADWLVEKCTELGASSLTPLLTERSSSISTNRADRLKRVALAASKQCQRLHEMLLKPPMKLINILPIITQSKLSFVAVAEAEPVFSVLHSLHNDSSGIMIIGPEGDFTKEELKLVVSAGASSVGLGQNRLRVETATIALFSALMLWSDSKIST